MARRHAEKTATQGAAARSAGPRGDHSGQPKAPPAAAAGASRIDSLEARLTAMEQERDFWRAQAETLKLRLRAVEDSQIAARDRLSWAIDAVQSILEKKG